MACYHPLKGYRGRDGIVRWARPIGEWAILAEVPCGKCIGCKTEHTRQWAIRIMHEAQLHQQNSFITLTYDDEHLADDRSLDVRDWQLFAKRFRENIGPFRFFHCGEYTEDKKRPHLHACIFGHNFHEDRNFFKNNHRGEPLYTSQKLADVWQNGYVTVGELTFESAAYVARYVLKKLTGEQGLVEYSQIDYSTGEIIGERKPPYTTMSRKPGIAKHWYDKYKDEVIRDDFVVIQKNKKARIPKYYDTQLEKEDPEMLDTIKKQRKKRGQKHKNNNTPERLHVRETVHQAKINLLKRPIT